MPVHFVPCPWCMQRNPDDALTCRFCGGPLTAGERMPSLPPPPRRLPKGYAWRLLMSSVGFPIGGTFLVLGLPMFCIFAGAGLLSQLWLLLLIGSGLSLLFVIFGAGLLYMAWNRVARYLRCYRHGLLTEGQVSEVFEDHSVVINGTFPWVIRYQYTAQGQNWEGEARLERSFPEAYAAGQRVYVLYLPDAPDSSVLFPSPI